MCFNFFVCECSVVGSRKKNFFRASIFATVSCSALSVRRNINKLKPNYLLIPKSNSTIIKSKFHSQTLRFCSPPKCRRKSVTQIVFHTDAPKNTFKAWVKYVNLPF